MDEDPAELVKAAAEGTATGLVKPFGDLLTTLLGGAAEEGGEYLRWRVRMFRHSRMQRLLQKTSEFIEEGHVEAEPVAPKILLPILENASLEDDDFLQDRWAMLLANAARGRGRSVLECAPEILKQLNPFEVMLLERCYDYLTMENKAPTPTPDRESMKEALSDWQQDLLENHGFRQSSMGAYYDFGVMMNNVCRLGLMERVPLEEPGSWDFHLTRMGTKLVQMCANFSKFNYKASRKSSR